jgi:hypothetical protein
VNKNDRLASMVVRRPKLALALIGIAALLFFFPRGSILLAPHDAPTDWIVQGAQRTTRQGDLLVVECYSPCFVLSPELHARGDLRDTTIVKLLFDGPPPDGVFEPVAAMPKQEALLRKVGPVGDGSLLVDLRHEENWQEVYATPAAGRIGVRFQGRLALRGIRFFTSPEPWDRARLLWFELGRTEPFMGYSINNSQGLQLWGIGQQVLFAGLLAAAILSVLLFVQPRLRRSTILAGVLALFVANHWATLHLLVATATRGLQTGLHTERIAEYRARYGEPFAAVTSELLAKVPRGKKLHACTLHVPGEYRLTNPAEVALLSDYPIVPLLSAEFILCAGPEVSRWNSTQQIFVSVDRQQQVRATPLLTVGREALLLQVQP